MAKKVAIVGGCRTPFCRSHSLYADLSNLDMLVVVLNGIVDKYALQNEQVGEVVGGAVVSHAGDYNLVREAAIGSGLANSTPGITMTQACGTSLQAVLQIGAKIAAGQIECGIAVGSDTVSDSPISLQRRFSRKLIKVSRRGNIANKLAAFKGFALRELLPLPPSVNEMLTGLSMGEHAERMAKEWQILRSEQDKFAVVSHLKAVKAYAEGFMDDMLVSCAGVFRDNNLRNNPSMQKIAGLPPTFDKTPAGTITAANSTPLTDGASAVLLASEEWAKERNLPVLAYLRDGETAALDYTAGDGLLMAPAIAVARMLGRNELALQDFDFYEIHEAFAAQVLCTLKAWGDVGYCQNTLGLDTALGDIDGDKINVKGSSIAIGHPFAATGGRITHVLAKLLAEKGRGHGLISICTAGGMGVSAILEAA
jgi:acetyl-CoA C-acetyltransferase